MSHTLSTDELAASTHLLHRHARCIDILTASRIDKQSINTIAAATQIGCVHMIGGVQTPPILSNYEIGGHVQSTPPQFCPVTKLGASTPLQIVSDCEIGGVHIIGGVQTPPILSNYEIRGHVQSTVPQFCPVTKLGASTHPQSCRMTKLGV